MKNLLRNIGGAEAPLAPPRSAAHVTATSLWSKKSSFIASDCVVSCLIILRYLVLIARDQRQQSAGSGVLRQKYWYT